MNYTEQLDVNLLDGYLDSLGQDIVQQMLDLYIEQSKTYIEDIIDSIAQESQVLWQERCHKMKGATGSVGLLTAHAKLVAIEKLPEQWPEKSAFISELNEINKNAVTAFKVWLDSK
ncbi:MULTISPECIES: phosphorelay protein [unclassified Colwellia]|uniref:phosphorelay protein n=1 Tax=unclassified Colwellia TaxID=196834 RepID=UPI0015F63215|nr:MULTISPECIES: phosphorelay protein [unclassified Colwellia]MBA6348519.1 phosphorelay protein [Colwellia sp. BRX8-9]MBA6382641.1 phosphorelay protein [Colwellia sp. BRX10-9]MBA6392882.1 phosphorelay protein [Colwellia sp. BRX10-6]